MSNRGPAGAGAVASRGTYRSAMPRPVPAAPRGRASKAAEEGSRLQEGPW
jgi:hypothetical protein